MQAAFLGFVLLLLYNELSVEWYDLFTPDTVKWRYNADQFMAILQSTAITAAEHESDLELTTDTPYLALTGELWGVCC